jgi:hypothetical protein
MLREKKVTLEGMVESHDELIMEIANEIGFNHMGEDAEDEEDVEDEDDDDGGDTVAPHAAVPPPIPTPPAIVCEVIIVEEEDPMEMVPEQESLEAHEVILADAEPDLLQPHLYNVPMRDHEESPSRMMDDLDDPTKVDYDVN